MVRRGWIGILFGALLAAPALAAPPTWHTSLQEGLAAAAKSGKPLLVMTAWARHL